MYGNMGSRNCHHIEDGAFAEYPTAEEGFLFYRGHNFLPNFLYIFLYSSGNILSVGQYFLFRHMKIPGT